jgi:hypothetical protein
MAKFIIILHTQCLNMSPIRVVKTSNKEEDDYRAVAVTVTWWEVNQYQPHLAAGCTVPFESTLHIVNVTVTGWYRTRRPKHCNNF